MKFIDEAKIYVKGGDGGDGCISFRREKFVPRGGPNGGNGGRGGHVLLRADASIATLMDCRYRKHFRASRGTHGKGKDMDGRTGQDIIIKVPLGTVVKDAKTGMLLKDLKTLDQEFLVAEGGSGGRGNKHFKTSTRQAPKFAQSGKKGEEREVLLELKLLADIGLIGLPNAGKSTLLSRISNANPKIADYPFTTKSPVLGVVACRDKSFVMADLPGLIEGAHEGAGMGIQFLRHAERTKAFLHLLDIADPASKDPYEAFQIISRELAAYKKDFRNYPRVIVLTKLDLPDVKAQCPQITARFKKKGYRVLAISAATGEGLAELIEEAAKLV